MRRLALAALAALSLALPAVRASADPFTSHFNDLVSELNLRDANLPVSGLTQEQRRQRAALTRSFRALSVDAQDLSGDLLMARKMAGAIEAGFPGDATLAGILAVLNDDLAADVQAQRDETVILISIAQQGKLRTRAEAKLAVADSLFIAADEEETQAGEARTRLRGMKAVVQAAKMAVKAGPGGGTDTSTMTAVVAGESWAANPDFGTAVGGLADVSDSTGGLRKIIVTGRRILPRSTNPLLPGETSRIQLSLLSAGNDVVAGTYLMGNSEGVNASASWYFEDEDENATQAVSISGSIQVTSLVLHAGSVDIAGTFTLTMYDGIADVTFDIGSGAFEALALPRSSVP
jgi:hypothetical protein